MNTKDIIRSVMLVLSLLVIIVVLATLNKAWALQNPPGCDRSAITTGIAFFFASGTCSVSGTHCTLTAESACAFDGVCTGSTECTGEGETCNLVHTEGLSTNLASCETIIITSKLASIADACCIQGGTLTVYTPDGINHNVTPSGGIPELCNDSAVSGKPVIYLNDGVTGTRIFSVSYNGFVETGNPDSPASAMTSLPAKYVACSANTACTTTICDQTHLTRLPAGERLGACVTTDLPECVVKPPKSVAAIDPLALILPTKEYLILVEILHPHEPKLAEIEQALRHMSPEQRNLALERARILASYCKAVEEAADRIK